MEYKKIFTDIYNNYGFGSSESRSGPGSTMSETEKLRNKIVNLVKYKNIKKVLDIPCGDFNWMKEIVGSFENYHGGDVVEQCIIENNSKYSNEKIKFSVIDLLTDEIPDTELLIVRDVIGHYSLDLGKKIIDNILGSKTKYLLTTSWYNFIDSEYYKTHKNYDVQIGRFYAVNLMSEPFNFPEPDFVIEEDVEVENYNKGNRKTLSLWDLDIVRERLNSKKNTEEANVSQETKVELNVEKKAKTKTTIVTGLWNLGRGNISESFSRKYDEYLKSFSKLLETDVNMYIFCDPSDEDFIWQHRSKENTVVNKMTLTDLLKWFEFTNLTNKIRTSEVWLSQSGWLRESPQATLEGYNPLVMSKMFMLNNVTIWNPFDSEYFYWIDAGITNTVHYGYFTHDKVFDNLPNFMDANCDFMFISYPYVGGTEIHGFDRDAIARYSDTGYVDYVCRGGFFGGNKEKINEINGKYYFYLSKTLIEGFMGTEESIFTILANLDHNIYRFEISDNGLIWPFFEELKKYKTTITKDDIEVPKLDLDPTLLLDAVLSVAPKKERKPQEETALYVIGFNSPNQFKTLIHSMMFYDKNFIDKTKKYLLNNSTDLSTTEQYEALCKSYGFEHIKKDNLGITGGRQWIADHFNDSSHKYCMFFEDDMFFHSDRVGYCRNGFNRYVPNLYDKVISVMKKERFDFLKFNFSEFFGDNGTQWSWYNVPQVVREAEFPEKTKLPVQGLDPDAPRTNFKNIRSVDGLSYISGDIYYSNWPQIMSKEGNKKCFIDTRFQFPYEQTIMSFIFQETRKGNIKPGLLLLTPTEHNRFEHYDGSLRKEC